MKKEKKNKSNEQARLRMRACVCANRKDLSVGQGLVDGGGTDHQEAKNVSHAIFRILEFVPRSQSPHYVWEASGQATF